MCRTILPFTLPLFGFGSMIDDRDLFISNMSIAPIAGPAGPQGPEGPAGPQGIPGPEGPVSLDLTVDSILVDDSYACSDTDCYIGVNSPKNYPTTITLPLTPENGRVIIIKAEMGSPLGNRKVTINTGDGSSIDGNSTVIITTPYGVYRLLYRGSNWHVF